MTYRTEAVLPFAFGPVAQMLRAQITDHDLTPEESPGLIFTDAQYGRLGARQEGDGVVLFIESDQEELLYLLQADMTEHLLELMPDLQIDWSMRLRRGAPPPNLYLGQVAEVTELSQSFYRLRLEGPELGALAGDHLHFRLLLPPDPAAPVWPEIGDRGQMVWPQGDSALHRPVYTTRAVGPGWLIFDVFRHAGGRTSDWAGTDPVGQQVAVMGPGGGGLPKAKRLLLAGDDTALPVIGRMLEDPRCPADVEIILTGVATDYPLLQGARWVDDLPQEVIRFRQEDQFLWAGAGRTQIQAIRAHGKKNGWDNANMHLVNYWS